MLPLSSKKGSYHKRLKVSSSKNDEVKEHKLVHLLCKIFCKLLLNKSKTDLHMAQKYYVCANIFNKIDLEKICALPCTALFTIVKE
jgi:hypothetical protein